MPATDALWESYFYPETYDRTTMRGTLRNLLGERDDAVLAEKEYSRSADRQRELMSGEVQLPRTYDAAHVRGIHRHLFQDVYEWAGKYRTVNIFKGTLRGFADAAGGEIARYLDDVHGLVDRTAWDRLGRDQFVESAATVFAYLNQAHPFREGNGRTSKVFMAHVAERSRFTLDYGGVTPTEWNEASKWSGPDLFAHHPQPASLLPVFAAITVDRSTAAISTAPDAARFQALYRASYPAPATDIGRIEPGRQRDATSSRRRSGYGQPERGQGRE